MFPTPQHSPLFNVQLYQRGKRLHCNADVLQIHTQRRLGQLAGSFALTMRPKGLQGNWAEGLAGDEWVVIRAARPHQQRGGNPENWPVLMAGQVVNVSEPQMISGDRPQWSIAVNGQDAGGWITEAQVEYYYENFGQPGLIGVGVGTGVLGIQKIGLLGKYKIQAEEAAASDFVNEIVTKIVHDYLVAPRQGYNTAIPKLGVSASVPPEFIVNGIVVQPFTGSVANLLETVDARPFTEMFIDDTNGLPSLVYRLSPLTNSGGTTAFTDAAPARATPILQRDVISSQLVKSRLEQFSSFFVYPAYTSTSRSSAPFEMAAPGSNPAEDAASQKRFGFRPFDHACPIINHRQNITADQIPDRRQSAKDNSIRFAQWAKAVYQDNYKLRSGSLTTVLLPHVGIGTYLINTDTGREAYIEGVSHEIDAVNGRARTTITVTRERQKP